MAKGHLGARQNIFLTVHNELVPGQFNASGAPYYAIDLATDGNGFDPIQRFVEHMPDGLLSTYGVALVGDEGRVSGRFMPHYEMLPLRLTSICGNPVISTLGDGRRKYVWTYPDGGVNDSRVDRPFFSGFYGNGANAVQLLYGKIMSMVIESARSGEVGGSMDVHFNRAIRGIALPGTTARNEVKTLTLTNATGTANLTVPATSLGAGGTVVITPGMAATGAGSLQTLLAAVAAIGSTANVAVVGTSTAAGAATDVATVSGNASSSAGSASTPGNATDADVNTKWSPGMPSAWWQYDTTTPTLVVSYAIHFANGVGDPTSWTLKGSNDVNFVTDVFTLDSRSGVSGLTGLQTFAIAVPQNLRYYRLEVTGVNGSSGISIGTIDLHTNTTGSGAYTITLQGALANMDIAEWTMSTTGYSIITSINGSDGTGPIMLNKYYLEPTHALTFIADSYADLLTINMGNLTTQVSISEPHLIRTMGRRFAIEGLVNPVYFEDQLVYPASHVDGEGTATMNITLPKDFDGVVEEIYATENGCSVTPKYFCQRYRCGARELWIDMYGSRNAAPGHPVENNIMQQDFPIIRTFNSAANPSLIFSVILPA